MRYLLVIGLLAMPGVAQAQAQTARPAKADRARVSINFGLQQPASKTFTGITTAPVYLETATTTTTYGVSNGKFFDGGVIVRLAGGFGVGAAVSSFTRSEAADVAGTVPHPFFFSTLRPFSGTSSALERSEVAVHIQAAYVISSRRVDVAISGGPSFFSVSQDLVANATYSEAYPFDTATFSATTVSKVTASKTGFNAGVDVGVKLSKTVGVGGLVRYSRASVNFPLPRTASGVTTDVGGPQVAGGIRFFF